jgi:predicted nuclease with TOPRIM domain
MEGYHLMFIPKAVFDLFQISKAAVDSQREELVVLRTERDALQHQVEFLQNSFDWLKMRVNALEVERAQLIEKAYGMKLPVPEIARSNDFRKTLEQMSTALFTDMGDDEARKQGLPTFDN